MIHRLVMPAVLGLLLPTGGLAFSDLDYCRTMAQIERERCHTEHRSERLDCDETAANERWFGIPTALEDRRACRRDARETCGECRGAVETCPEEAAR